MFPGRICVGYGTVNLSCESKLELFSPALITTSLLGNLGQMTRLFCSIFFPGEMGLARLAYLPFMKYK